MQFKGNSTGQLKYIYSIVAYDVLSTLVAYSGRA